MNDFSLAETPQTPRIEFNLNGEFHISGISIPDNVVTVFEPVLNWLYSNLNDVAEPIKVHADIEYLNTSSTKMVCEILDVIAQNKGKKNILLNWNVDKEDEDLIELGNFLGDKSEITTKIIFKN